ncbi:MAG: sugar ABC transporter permease [Chloroflexi bacterium]|nr:sugar ABC transporter permease [Chloroflexota bacterium]
MTQEALQLPERTRASLLNFRQSGRVMGYLLVAPLVICLLILIVYPFFFAVSISFTDRVVGGGGEWVGLENYARMVSQPSFPAAVSNTIVLVVAVQMLKLIFGLGIAVLLSQQIRGRQFWRALILLPWAMPAFVAFITWKLLYAPQGGAFNYILIGLGLVPSHVDFLSTKELALPSVIVASFWRGFPFWVISFLAAMQTIPRELYESAALDGANGWGRFRNVTVPGIRHVILVVILTSTIWTTNSFEAVWLLTGGGPSNATMTFPLLAYYGLQSLRIGEAAAASVALLPVFAVLAVIIAVRLQKE